MSLQNSFNKIKRSTGIKKCVMIDGNVGDVYLDDKKKIVTLREYLESMLKEMDYLMREQDAAAEERYKKLDQAIRGHLRKKKTLFSKKESVEKDVKAVPLKEKKILSIEQPT